MVDFTDPRGLKREIEQEAYGAYERLSGVTLARRPDGSFEGQGHNDPIDAFRHAYVSVARHPAGSGTAVDRTPVWKRCRDRRRASERPI